MYLNMLRTSTLTVIHQFYENEPFYFQQNGAPHYHRDVRCYLNETLPGQWIGRKGSGDYPPRAPDLTHTTFICGGP
jgi:hypothetical protein